MAETYDDAGASASPSVVAAIWSAAGGPAAPLEARRLLLLERLAVPGPRVDWAAVSDLIDDALVEAGRVDLAAVSDLVDDTLVKAGLAVAELVEPVRPGRERIIWCTSREGHTEAAPVGRSVRVEIDVAPGLLGEEEIVLAATDAPAEDAAGGAAETAEAAEAAAPPPAEAPASEESAGEAEAAPVEETAEASPAPVDKAAAPGEAEPAPVWTPERDLTLVEGFAAGDNSSKIAQRLGVKAPDCVRRYRELMPQSGVAAQQRLLKRLRAEAGVA